jgi:HK97 family phage major capsid protein
MKTKRDLLARRDELRAKAKALRDARPAGDFSADEIRQIDQLESDVTAVNERLSAVERLEELERRAAGQPVGSTGDTCLDAELRNFSLVRAIAAGVPNSGVDSGREIELSREIARRAGRPFQGMAVPMSVFHEPVEQRVLTTTNPSTGPGSNLIQTTVDGGQYIDRLRAALRVRQLGARVLTGLVGNLDLPKLKASATAGWVAENAALTASDPEFQKVSLTPKHAGALTEFSRNMLMQTSPDVESLIRADFAAVLAETVDAASINGSGSGATPRGILNTSGIGAVAIGTNGGPITWDAVVNLIGEVEIDNAFGGAFLTNSRVVRSARKTPKVSGQPVYIADGATMASTPVAVTNLVPSNLTKGTSSGVCSALIFGNWSDLILAYWSEFDLLVNPYESTAYSKGNVQVRGMVTMDVAVRYPESFAAITDLTTP